MTILFFCAYKSPDQTSSHTKRVAVSLAIADGNLIFLKGLCHPEDRLFDVKHSHIRSEDHFHFGG